MDNTASPSHESKRRLSESELSPIATDKVTSTLDDDVLKMEESLTLDVDDDGDDIVELSSMTIDGMSLEEQINAALNDEF